MTNEFEVEEEVVEVEDVAEQEEDEVVVEKPTESLADKKARLERQLAQTNKKLGITEDKPTKTQSTDFGYDVKAYLKASGIAPTEFDFVKAELKGSGMKDVDALLENDYFKSKLEKHRELSKTQEAIPSGKRSGGVATDSVEYWMGKPIEEVPADKRRAVVNAKLEQEKNKGKFYNG